MIDPHSRHISQVIHAAPQRVYEYASEPDNLPRWAAGLAESEVSRDGAEVVFTIRQLAMSDDEFERDAAIVQRDLEALRDLVQGTE